MPAAGAVKQQGPPVHQGQQVSLRCERLALGGKGVCFQTAGTQAGLPSKFVILCERALPGEQLVARVDRVHKAHAEATKLAVTAPHAHAVPAPCPHFGPCGGCTLQSLSYEQQLAEKSNQVLQTLKRVGKLPDVAPLMLPIVGYSPRASPPSMPPPPPLPLGFRNKLVFTWSSWCWQPSASSSSSDSETLASPPPADAAGPAGGMDGTLLQRPVLGFLRPGSARDVLPVTSCLLGPPAMAAVLRAASQAAEQAGLLPANDPSGRGVLRNLVVRQAPGAWRDAGRGAPSPQQQQQQQGDCAADSIPFGASKEQSGQGPALLMVIVTTAGAPADALLRVARRVTEEVPEVAGVLHKVVAAEPPAPWRPAASLAAAASPASSSPVLVTRTTTAVAESESEAGAPTAEARSAAVAWRAGRGGQARAPSKAPAADRARQQQQDAGGGGQGGEDGDAGGLAGEWLAAPGGGGSPRSALLLGTSYLLERLGRLALRVHAESFFQTNVAQAERLYDAVAAGAQLRPTDHVVDLYCGCGSIALTLADKCAHVTGCEVVEEAVVDARFNAQLNGVRNASFLCGDLGRGVPSAQGDLPPDGQRCVQRPDVVVVNPARAGLSQAVVAYLRRCTARRVVYVSCNPATLARDLALLTAQQQPQRQAGSTGGGRRGKPGGADVTSGRPFRLLSVQPVDMFPHSDHCECVVVLDHV